MNNPNGDWLTSQIHQFETRLVAYAMTYLNDIESARDVVQDTFLRLYQQPDRTRIKAGWLFTVTRNLAFDRLRKTERDQRLLREPLRAPESGEDQVIRRLDVERVLDNLRDQDRELLLLFYYQGWSMKTIARHYQLPASTIRLRLARARDAFRRMVPDNLERRH